MTPQPQSGGSEWAGATHWSAILAAGREGSPHAAAAMEELCGTYWFPLYAYIRRRGYNTEEAQDLTQEFFARLIEHHWLQQADPAKGRFRCFLLSAMNHFLAKEWRRTHAAKRGGGKTILSLDDTAEARYSRESATDLTPEKIYERRWALNLFDRALARLRGQYTASGKGEVYAGLKEFLSSEPGEGDYARAGAQLGLNRGAVAAAVHRLRGHYSQVVREEIARTVASPGEVEDEMRSLLAALG